MLNQTEFIKGKGRLCPICGSKEIKTEELGPFDYDEIISCLTCKSEWEKIYKLAGFRILKEVI